MANLRQPFNQTAVPLGQPEGELEMPKRTNEFQELVSLIRHSLAREGDSIEDSAMVKVQGLETEREIDILHQTSDGFSTTKIAIEARDEGRPLDVGTLDELKSKY